MNQPVVKNALVCDTKDLPEVYLNAGGPVIVSPIPSSFWYLKSRLADRAVCETDESTQQFLPYITVYDNEKRIFVYSRGKGGAEARLIGNLSIGLGGHVDEEVPAGYSTLYSWLSNEGRRELLEEAGLEINDHLNFAGLIRDTSNPVGRVHLGVWAAVKVSAEDVSETEAEIVENGEWLTLPEILEPKTYDRLENWSKAVVIYLMDNGFPVNGIEEASEED